jgi:hypothetical protein
MLTRLRLAVLVGAAVQMCSLTRTFAAEPTAEEYQVKGAYLLNFAKFVEWPPQAFKGPADAIMICVIGQNPFGPALDAAARGVLVSNRPISVRQIADGQQATQCPIAFASVSERKSSRALLEAVAGGSVLTVGESDDFLAKGGRDRFQD